MHKPPTCSPSNEKMQPVLLYNVGYSSDNKSVLDQMMPSQAPGDEKERGEKEKRVEKRHNKQVQGWGNESVSGW